MPVTESSARHGTFWSDGSARHGTFWSDGMQAEQLERCIERFVEARCREVLQSDAVQASLQQRLDEQRRLMEKEVESELAAERARADEERLLKEAAIAAKQAELQALHDARRAEVRFPTRGLAHLLLRTCFGRRFVATSVAM